MAASQTVQDIAASMNIFLPVFDHLIAMVEGLFNRAGQPTDLQASLDAAKAAHARATASLTGAPASPEAAAKDAPDAA